MSQIRVRGARQHNLQGVDVSIPRDALTVISGPSGSGKSSLAFDTIFAEGQRRYVEAMSVGARRWLDALPRPDVDLVEGLSPAIAVSQRPPSGGPRSTVATVTELHDHLRLLFARAGTPHCPVCGVEVRASTVPEIVARVLELPEGTRLAIHAPLGRRDSSEWADELERLRRDGFVRVAVDGAVMELSDALELRPGERELDVQIDRVAVRPRARARLSESLELAFARAGGRARIVFEGGESWLVGERLACPEHGALGLELEPRSFSFNTPEGACPSCGGLGRAFAFDADRVIPDPSLSLDEGAIAAWGKAGGAYHRRMMKALLAEVKVDRAKSFRSLAARTRRRILEGGGGYEGVIPGLERRARALEAEAERGDEEQAYRALEDELARFMVERPCASCGGERLAPAPRIVEVGGRTLPSLSRSSLAEVRAFFVDLRLEGVAAEIVARVLAELRTRLAFLCDVGLGYLSLDRRASSLSAGEAQRIRLASQLGSSLVGVLYVLDEPSIGLHSRDVGRLITTLERLRDAGNTVLVVEHDEAIIRAADWVVDMGPGAGRAGGRVVAEGPPASLAAEPGSPTGAYLAGRRRRAPKKRRRGRGRLSLSGARTHNLKGETFRMPLGTLTCVTGVSGSGKSSLVVDTLLPLVRAALGGEVGAEPLGTLEGADAFEAVIAIDQAPIGRTPRSSPATFSGVFGPLRSLYASLPEARARGYASARFSFNVKGGRCEACAGDGAVRVAMHFLPDVYVRCRVCEGRRYAPETLEVRYRGLSIADVLELSVEEALPFFEVTPKIRRPLDAMLDVGLGYLPLGQPATTLSGGEAQRLKLARELARRAEGPTLYVLDEPTTGLHPVDVEVLLDALDALVDKGHSVLVIEHDLDVIRAADHVVDLGPEGGDAGGHIIAAGTPEELAECVESHTGRALR